ncbi:MAG: CPBP family intramembrane glutamic endopeptidase [Candidatus Micrarchaeota archaeon]
MKQSDLFIIFFSIFVLLVISGFFIFNISYWQVVVLHFGLFSISLCFLYNKNISTTLKNIGILDVSLSTVIYYTFVGLVSVFLLSIILGILVNFLKINDQSNVASKVNSFPYYILFFGIFIAPFTEELFFRGFLSSKIGNFLSTAIFALFHILYGSITEVIGVFFIGYLFAIIYKRSGSLWPCILIHLLFNLFSISMIKVIS